MDDNRFATLLRCVSAASSRRRALRLLAGMTLGGFVSAAVQPGAARDQRQRKLKKRKPCRNMGDDSPCASAGAAAAANASTS